MSWFAWPGWREFAKTFAVQIVLGVLVVALGIAAIIGWLVRR